jgi:MFS family permease
VIYLGANVGLALQNNYAALMVLRCLQACGSSGTVALANAVAADIITSAERGEYISYTSVGGILAPTLAPFLGGVLSQYAGWRWIFWFLFIFAIAFFTPFLIFFPETCRRIVGNGSIPPPRLNQSLPSYLRERRLKKDGRTEIFAERDRRLAERHIRFPNPIGTLRIVFDKVAGLTLLGNGLLFSCYYAVTASLPSQFHLRYGLDDFEVALIFLPFGVGGILSAFTTGKIIDWNYRRHAIRLGFPVERNRQSDLSKFPIERARLEIALPVIFIGGAAILLYGWLIQANVHISGPCIILFLVGYSITAGFNCMNILLVDMYPGKPATATAANNLVRCWLGAGSSAASVPLINAVGIGWAATIAAAIWVGYTPVLFVIMKNGPRWRREAKEALERKRSHRAEKTAVSSSSAQRMDLMTMEKSGATENHTAAETAVIHELDDVDDKKEDKDKDIS